MEGELPDKNKIKLIATDIDGTLLNKKGKVTEETKTVITKILDKYPDIHFVFVTARTRLATLNIRKALDIWNRPNTESINSNGCIIYNSNGEIISQNVLPKEYIIKFHNILKSYPKAIHRYIHGDGIITFSEKLTKRSTSLIRDNIEIKDKEEHMMKFISGEMMNINIVGYFKKDPDSKEILEKLEKLKEEYNLVRNEPAPVLIEYLPPDTNKGTSLTRLINSLNISKDEVIAFGDGSNDHELLESAGWPVAMGNASEELKSCAKFITKTNGENGVAYVLKKIFLNEDEDEK